MGIYQIKYDTNWKSPFFAGNTELVMEQRIESLFNTSLIHQNHYECIEVFNRQMTTSIHKFLLLKFYFASLVSAVRLTGQVLVGNAPLAGLSFLS